MTQSGVFTIIRRARQIEGSTAELRTRAGGMHRTPKPMRATRLTPWPTNAAIAWGRRALMNTGNSERGHGAKAAFDRVVELG